MNKWNRKIDQIFGYEKNGGRVRIFCYDGSVYTGTCVGDCESLDANGEDADGIRFAVEELGKTIIFIEDDIERIEFL